MFLNPAADPVRFATSWLFNAHHLAMIRALFSLYAFTTIIISLIWYATADDEPKLAGEEFSYFTIISYWGLAFYFAFAAFHSTTYWLRGRPALASWGTVLIQLHSILYSTIVVYPFIVTSKLSTLNIF
jgi:cytochrome bd-type quinol oxidase subunit 2